MSSHVFSRVELFLTETEIPPHYLLQSAGLALSARRYETGDLIQILQTASHEIAINNESLDMSTLAHLPREHLKILFEISELDILFNKMNALLESGFGVDLLFHRQLNASEINSLDHLAKSPHFRLLFLESKLYANHDLLQNLPAPLRNRIHFVYLPKMHASDCLMSPEEIMNRIELREKNCLDSNLSLKILGFSLNEKICPQSLLRDFYEEPSRERYLTYMKKKTWLAYFFFQVSDRLGVSSILEFLFWLFKVILNPSAYRFKEEFKSWQVRAVHRIESIPLWKAKSFLLKILGETWRVKATVQKIHSLTWGEAWRLRVLFSRVWSGAWKLKKVFHELRGMTWGQAWRIKAFLQRVWGETWKVKKIFYKTRSLLFQLLGNTWRIKALGHKILGQIWRIQGQTWRLKVLFFRLRGEVWRLRKVVEFLLFPFRKIYWFCKYQYETRVMIRFLREESRDD